MHYLEFLLKVTPNEEYITDLLASSLGEIGFESFEKHEEGLIAYIQEKEWDERQFSTVLKEFPYTDNIHFQSKKIEQINWNEQWEQHYFQPIVIDNDCVVHSSFHQHIPVCRYSIIIDPKMSFGTGHHETTSLMLGEILQLNLENTRVLDMGCGTAVLAILASKKGADQVMAIDIDPWCIENTTENLQKNNITNVDVCLGDVDLLVENEVYDVIFANINRNILLNQIQFYSKSLKMNGLLLMSGFFTEDIAILQTELSKHNCTFVYAKSKNNWVMIRAQKMA